MAVQEDVIKVLFENSTAEGYLTLSSIRNTLEVFTTSLWWIDLTLSTNLASHQQIKECLIPLVDDGLGHSLYSCLRLILKSLDSETKQASVLIRLLLPRISGYVTRSDFLAQRLECCREVDQVFTFTSPLQRIVAANPYSELSSLEQVIVKAIGAVTLSPSSKFSELDGQFNNRLSSPWIVPGIPSRSRLAWVQGREDIDCIERAFKSAKALGIDLIILDEKGHWLQDPASPWAYLREAFIEVDITPDGGLDRRVVHAIRTYGKRIDGIVTISDIRLPAIARACRILGLPTESPEAYDIAGDKGKTRLLENIGKDESFVLETAGDLKYLLADLERPLVFPLVVKPVIGWCSDCVSKVSNVAELTIAVQKASERHAEAANPSTRVVIEPYIDGPEVDANLAVLDGEILFCDINDDFPSPADDKNASFKANFQETQNVIPSNLPEKELENIRQAMLETILRQGFNSGIFHCEARVRNSTVEYTVIDGVVDLAKKKHSKVNGDSQVYLHEVNARPPGYLETVAVLLSYGVDYYALRMLLALGKRETSRLRALSHPFRDGPQFHLSLMIIQQTRAGVMKTTDAAKNFLEAHPEFTDHVVDYYTRKKGGDILEGPEASALWWIAYFSVTSRKSRNELLQRVEYIQRNFEYDIEA